VPALTFGVSTNFALANSLASRSFGNVSVALAPLRFPRGRSNETYHVPLDLSAMGDAFPRLRAARADARFLAQLGDFEIANCLIKADRTHDDGKQSDERPSQRRATADRASGDPNAKGNDTYRDLERECGIHAGLHSKEERSA
jgi:hypothetical protein